MKGWGKVAILLLAAGTLQASTQGAPEGRTQARGVWTDPSTGLLWAGQDNGGDVGWKGAVKYCRVGRWGGSSAWGVAALSELQGLFDTSVEASGRDGQGASTWHVKGGLFLTGSQWSSTRVLNDRGRPSGYAYRFDFNEGKSFDGDELYFHTFKRALCVRSPKK